jgi:hypothetical protein
MDSSIFEEHPLTVLSSIVRRMSSMSSMRRPIMKITILGSGLDHRVAKGQNIQHSFSPLAVDLG